MIKTFSIKEALKHGWDKMRQHFLFVVGVIAISFIISLVFDRLQDLLGDGAPLVGFIIFIASVYVSTVISIGSYKIFLKLNDGQHAELKDLYLHYRLFGKYFLGTILYLVIVVIGLILLIIPGIYFSIKYSFLPLILVDDEDVSISEAFSRSADITLGVKWKLLGFGIVVMLVLLLGALLLGIGLLVAIPVATFAFVHVYRKLGHETAGEVVVVEEGEE